jgi:hypothetical protein
LNLEERLDGRFELPHHNCRSMCPERRGQRAAGILIAKSLGQPTRAEQNEALRR